MVLLFDGFDNLFLSILRTTRMDFAMGWNRFNLSLLGVWPEPSKTTLLWRMKSAFLFWTSSSVIFLFICAPQITNLILNSASLDEAIEYLSVIVPIVSVLLKQIVLRYHGKVLKSLLVEILNDWSQDITKSEHRMMLKNAKISRRISFFCSTLTYLVVVAFVLLQVYTNKASSSKIDLGGLLFPSTFPYNTKKSPYFEITWIGQFVGSVLTVICYSCFDTFVAVLVLHLCGQLSVLQSNLTDLGQIARQDAKAFETKLGFIVNRHVELHKFALIVEECFNLTLLVQTMISAVMFCLTGYRMITSVDAPEQDLAILGLIFLVLHESYTMLHLYIYCYIGETLLVESTGIAFSAYDCEWYNLPSKKALCLMIVIHRARVAFNITAGKFSPFSLQLFGAIMKTSAGYLSVLLAMRDRLIEEQ